MSSFGLSWLVLVVLRGLSLRLATSNLVDFDDLGKHLLGGFVVAIVVAVAFTFIKLRLRDKKPTAQFISISSSQSTDEKPTVAPD